MPSFDVPTDGPLARFATDLIAVEFPELPDDRRVATVAFCCRRCAVLPDPLRWGVRVAAGTVEVGGRLVGRDRATAWFRRVRLPLVGDLARLVRSLAVAFIWERWPDTGPLGAPGGRTATTP